jgi:RNA polymerase sigma-70 factor (ECF subfamily)
MIMNRRVRSNSKQSDSRQNQFVRDLRRRNEETVRCFLEEYRPRVFSFVFSMLMNKEDAEDVTQEALVKVLQNIDRFKGDSSLTTWVFRIARNSAIDLRRKSIRSDASLANYREVTDFGVMPMAEAPDVTYQTKEGLGVLVAIMEKLSSDHREILVLREVDGLSYEEIAEVVGISSGTVMSRLFYARKKLQEGVESASQSGGERRDRKSSLKVVGR